MMWGKLREIAPDDKRLRCQASVTRGHGEEGCRRLAKRYNVSSQGNMLGEHALCNNHAMRWSKKYDINRIYRRKKKESE